MLFRSRAAFQVSDFKCLWQGAWIPERMLTTNEEKGAEFHCTPPPGPPPTAAYPVARFQYRPVTLADAQIEHTIKSSRMHKAPGPHDIPNEVYGRCADILLPHLGPLFCATFGLNYYPAQWQV